MTAKHNKEGRINFGVCYMNERYPWGYEIVDTLEWYRKGVIDGARVVKVIEE